MPVLHTIVARTIDLTALVLPALGGRLAFAVLRRPAGRARAHPEEQELIGRAEQDAIDLRGTRVATYRWGSGRSTVLLVHGWASRASRLGALVDALVGAGHTVVAFDAPGHGASGGHRTTILDYRDIVLELQRRHGSFDTVIGYSFGALSSFVALRGGLRARRLVVLAGVSRFEHLVTGFREQLGLHPRVDGLLRSRVEGFLRGSEPDVWRRFSADARPGEVLVERILVVHDEDDEVVGVHQAHEVAAAYGERAELVLTRGLGHRRIRRDPEVVARVLDFVGPAVAAR